jgi:hypothetical protein
MSAPLRASRYPWRDDPLDSVWREELSFRQDKEPGGVRNAMPQRVHLDAMIHREDFATEDQQFAPDLFPALKITELSTDSPIMKLLRKPDFQRETNYWTPEQIVEFIESFLDDEVIPSLILWNSSSFVFAIDGGHRLSALRAWIEDDYGDRAISGAFYSGGISKEQKRVAARTRKLVEERVGRFSTLRSLVGSKDGGIQSRRAKNLFTRTITVQWVQ